MHKNITHLIPIYSLDLLKIQEKCNRFMVTCLLRCVNTVKHSSDLSVPPFK